MWKSNKEHFVDITYGWAHLGPKNHALTLFNASVFLTAHFGPPAFFSFPFLFGADALKRGRGTTAKKPTNVAT